MDRHADSPDDDMFTDEKESFQTSCRLTGDVQLAKEYVLHLEPSHSCRFLAAGLANSKVSLLDAKTLSKTDTLNVKGLSGLAFSPQDDHLLYTCSSQDSVKLWDLREPSKPAKVFVDSSDGHKKPVISLGVSCDSCFVAAGTEQVVTDAFVLFWDVRNEKMCGGYWDSYGDDVTCIRFHANDPNKMATGGTDGLINVFDISQETEDDALITTLNTESSVRDLFWYSNKSKDSIAAVSCDEDLILWPNVDGIEHKNFSREDLTIAIRRKAAEWCYLVDAHFKTDSHEIMVVAKSTYPKKPCLRLATVKKSKLKPYANLKSKSQGNARCSALDSLSGTLFIGNEEGCVQTWMQNS